MIMRRLPSGILDTDTSYYSMGSGNYPHARNMNISGDGSSKPVLGNRLVDWTLPLGENSVIGYKEDPVRNRAFIFVFNDYFEVGPDVSTQYYRHQILIYNKTTGVIQKLIENQTDTGGADILRFSKDFPILHIDVLHRDGEEGDILSWTDGNTQPKELLIDKVLNGDYGVVTIECIEAAKRPPLNAPSNSYSHDATRSVNSLRKKLFQFKYRWVYDDFSKSTWSPIGKMPLPIDIFFISDLDNNPQYNNVINIDVRTGTKNVSRIEIAGRASLGSTWSDFFLVTSLDKSELGLLDNTVTTYKFYNDSVYPYVDLRESLLLFDWLPRKAFAQCLANGNVKVYFNILEGYDRVTDLDIRVTSDEILNNPEEEGIGEPSADMVWESEPQLPGEVQVGYLNILGDPIPGTRYVVYWKDNPANFQEIFMDYTAEPGDTNEDVAAAMVAQQSLYASVQLPLNPGEGRMLIAFTDPEMSFYSEEVIQAPAGATEAYEGTWPWWSRYFIGIVYFDEQGRTNGVHIDKTGGRSNSDVITTPYNESAGIAYTPYLDVEIRHQAPSWAVKYQLVRSRNLVMDDFLMWRTDDYQDDGEYLYFSIQTLVDRRTKQASYVPNWEFVEGDRMRVVVDNIGPSQTLPTSDYLVVGIEDKEFSSVTRRYVKIRKPVSAPALADPQLIMLWRPAKTGGQASEEVFYEFGEVYDIYTSGSNKFHRGAIQDQTGVQPARIIVREGDVFYRKRTFATADALYIADKNYSDDFESAVNSNGRPQVIDYDARETWFPVLARFGLEYQKGTSLNGLNRFYFDNLDEYDRQYGSVQKVRVNDRSIRIFQELKCGVVPVLQSIITDNLGSDVLAQSDRIINPIQYYAGDFGIGKHPESHASFGLADYFIDVHRGTPCRLSLNGITPLAIDWDMHPYFVRKLRTYTDADKFWATFEPGENRYIVRMPSVSEDEPAVCIAFNEDKRGFEAEYEFDPEFMGPLGTSFVAFRDGSMWIHDRNSPRANFFGVQRKPQIGLLFNDLPMIKKTFQAVTYVAGGRWWIPEITTSLGKESHIHPNHFKKMEDAWHAPILRDVNSQGGLLSGAMLKGNWILCIFEQYNAGQDDEFQYAEVKYVESKLNAR